MLLLLAALLPVAVTGQMAEGSLDPLLGLLTCVQDNKPGYCLRERALGYFESWLTGDEGEEQTGDTEEDAEPTSRLSPYWRKVVDQVAERIAGFYNTDEDEEDEEDPAGQAKQLQADGQTEDSNNTALDGTYKNEALSRGHHKKKKKIKAIKKAIIKLVLIALLIKSKLKMLLTAFQTFLQFKAVALATIYVLIHVVKLWVEIKHKHHPQKVIYYENAHHQHHYDHHDDHHHEIDEHSGGGGGWSLWGRSGLEATTTPFPLASFLGRANQDLAYSAHIPASPQQLSPLTQTQ